MISKGEHDEMKTREGGRTRENERADRQVGRQESRWTEEGKRAREGRESILSWKSVADTQHHELACVRIVYPFQPMEIGSEVAGYKL